MDEPAVHYAASNHVAIDLCDMARETAWIQFRYHRIRSYSSGSHWSLPDYWGRGGAGNLGHESSGSSALPALPVALS